MVQARALVEQSDFRGACLAADGAMRIVSPDPLGVRLEALEILSSMSAAAISGGGDGVRQSAP